MKYAWTLAICLAILCFAASSEAAPQKKALRDAHVDLACADCHTGQKNPKQAGAMSCAKCHDASEVAGQTASRGKKNPHSSPHWGTEVPCWTCHKEHAEDQNYCLICHTW